MSKYTIPSY